MPSSAHDIAVFRVANPDVIAYTESNDTSLDRTLASDGVLSEAEIVTVRAWINDEYEHDAVSPAREWHAPWVPNGDYTVTLNGVSFDFRIHLVQSGTLQGQRIIKVKHPGSSLYSGFAFVTRNGLFSLWRRFSHHAQAPYVIAATTLLDHITRESESLARRRDEQIPTARFANASVGDRVTMYGGSFIIRNLRCIHCNNAAPSSTNPYPLCADHAFIPPQTVEVPAPSVDGRSYARRTTTPRPRTSRSRSVAATRVSTVPMSQVTGKYVR